jgi:CheY-like chemotaxis protein
MSHDRTEVDRRRVLVVEDCDDDFDTVFEAATRAHVSNRLIRAADAEAARSLLARDAAGSFAFMLLDYNLPGMDGLALLEAVRRDPALAALPAVIYTTSVNPGDRDAFCRAGANAFHVKSVQHTDCLRTLAFIFAQWLGDVPPHGAAMPT